MNWEDEPYIKEYTRDTVEFKLLPWQAKCIAGLMRRKLDRAGVMEIGKYTPAQAVAAMIDVPIEIVEAGLAALLDDGSFVVRGNSIVCPNYIEAQEARQSDKARQAASRQRRRDKAGVTENHTASHDDAKRDRVSQNVTGPSQNVTNGHTVSHGVTNRIEENRIEENTHTARECFRVVRILKDTTGQPYDAQANKSAGESILRMAREVDAGDPWAVVEAAVARWWADPWVQKNRPSPGHLVSRFSKYATETPVEKRDLTDNEEYAGLKRKIGQVELDLKLAEIHEPEKVDKAKAFLARLKERKTQIEGGL